MRRPGKLALLSLVLPLAAACSRLNTVDDPSEPTAAQAKAAIVALLQTTDNSDLRLFLEGVKRAAPVDDGQFVTIGPCTCQLRERTFVLALAGDEAFLEFVGRLHRQMDGRWTATAEISRQT